MNTPTLDSPQRASLQSTTGRIAAVATALLLVLFLVLSVSRAAFTASTDNNGNTVTAGGVTLTDNDAGQVLFTIENAAPGEPDEQCIDVRYECAFDSGDVDMYVRPTDPATSLGDLAPFLNVTVDIVDLGDVPLVANPTHDCTVFNAAAGIGGLGLPLPLTGPASTIYDGALSDFASDHATGEFAFAAEQGTHAFRITVEVQNDPAAAGLSAGWDFVWETQSA